VIIGLPALIAEVGAFASNVEEVARGELAPANSLNLKNPL